MTGSPEPDPGGARRRLQGRRTRSGPLARHAGRGDRKGWTNCPGTDPIGRPRRPPFHCRPVRAMLAAVNDADPPADPPNDDDAPPPSHQPPSHQPPPKQPDQQKPEQHRPEPPPSVETFSHVPVAARVPPRIGAGTFCTGQVILDGPREFVVDFLQGLTRPFQVVARVVLAPATAAELADTLRRNVEMYTHKYGPPAAVPGPQNPRRPTLAEVYENFRLTDDQLSGNYANSVLVGHSPTEFFMDFLTGFYPTSAVSARVFMAAPQVPRFITALTASLEQHGKRFGGGGGPPPPPPQKPPGPPSIAG